MKSMVINWESPAPLSADPEIALREIAEGPIRASDLAQALRVLAKEILKLKGGAIGE